MMEIISIALLLRLSGIGQWHPSSKHIVCSLTGKITRPQWHSFAICTGRNIVSTISMSQHVTMMLSTTFLKTHPEDRNDGSNMLWQALFGWFFLSQYFCINKFIYNFIAQISFSTEEIKLLRPDSVVLIRGYVHVINIPSV